MLVGYFLTHEVRGHVSSCSSQQMSELWIIMSNVFFHSLPALLLWQRRTQKKFDFLACNLLWMIPCCFVSVRQPSGCDRADRVRLRTAGNGPGQWAAGGRGCPGANQTGEPSLNATRTLLKCNTFRLLVSIRRPLQHLTRISACESPLSRRLS